jgi:hypothetical protein
LLRVEEAYFHGRIVAFLQPSVTSSNPNQVVPADMPFTSKASVVAAESY